ncbi:peptidyl-tRNA hydrolase-like protein [Phaeobacter inhibens]|nr:peptidyl-tRNA hydrolase-like protein [Phaeobacter inhibens]AUQ81039.1 peptidyl-tRNA hydrolase-like protein [Phaeobacter inhibens]AUQ88727.1 peptidyl-tRNA hydrolase-like protein [Phaeobacter inhibens]
MRDTQSTLPNAAPAFAWTLANHRSMVRPMLRITDTIALQDWELTESFMRASGPGGQNVNKVSSAVELRFEAARSPALTPAVKSRLKRLAGRRWTKDGAIILQCDETRSQQRNRDLVRERLAELIRQSLVAPKRRIATKPTRGSVRRRLDAKRQRSDVKATRGKIDPD